MGNRATAHYGADMAPIQQDLGLWGDGLAEVKSGRMNCAEARYRFVVESLNAEGEDLQRKTDVIPPSAVLIRLVPIPVEFAAVTIDIAIFAAKLAALVTGRAIVSVAEIVAQFATVVCDFGLVVSHIPAQTTVARQSRRNAHSH